MGRFDNEEIEYLNEKLNKAVELLEDVLSSATANTFINTNDIEEFLKSID